MSLYLIINILVISVPLILTADKKVNFYKKLRFYVPALLITALIFIVWDILFVQLNVWGFNAMYLNGLEFWGLPIEEILFFICIPYACSFLYETFKTYGFTIENKWFTHISTVATIILALWLLIQYQTLYLQVTLAGLIALLLVVYAMRFIRFLSHFYFTFLLCLVPFTITNGILTGTGIHQEVVYYNPDFITNVKFVSIPVEDFFYFLFMFLLNIFLFEYFRRKRPLGY